MKLYSFKVYYSYIPPVSSIGSIISSNKKKAKKGIKKYFCKRTIKDVKITNSVDLKSCEGVILSGIIVENSDRVETVINKV